MHLDALPIALVFLGTILIVLTAMEVGFRFGRVAYRRTDREKESPATGMTAAVLGLLAFMLAFTFSLVSDRFDMRKALVRDEANAIRTAYMRAELLPADDATDARALVAEYLDARLQFAQHGAYDAATVAATLSETHQIQRRLWQFGIENARAGMNSDYVSLYLTALNAMFDIQAERVALGIQARIPTGLWVALYTLAILAMACVGYQTGIAGSNRSFASPFLAVAFSLVVSLVAALDKPQTDYVRVSQQPLVDVQTWMAGSQPLEP